MESELFGHEKGAFTGANARERRSLPGGRTAARCSSTRSASCRSPLQVKLCACCRSARCVRSARHRGARGRRARGRRDATATSKPRYEEGSFRQDLFYRLNVIRIQLPPLRERAEDILMLAQHFLQKHAGARGQAAQLSRPRRCVDRAAAVPGNVRELENVVERAITLARGPRIDLEDIPEASPVVTNALPQVALGPGFDLDAYMTEVEKSLLHQALEEAGGVRTNAARLLGHDVPIVPLSPREARGPREQPRRRGRRRRLTCAHKGAGRSGEGERGIVLACRSRLENPECPFLTVAALVSR